MVEWSPEPAEGRNDTPGTVRFLHNTPEGCQNRTKFIEQPALWHPSGVRRVFNAGPGVSLRSTPGYSL